MSGKVYNYVVLKIIEYSSMKICLITFFFSFSLYSGYDFDFGGGGSWWKQKENKTSVKRENNAGIMDLVNGFQLSVERTRDGHGFAL